MPYFVPGRASCYPASNAYGLAIRFKMFTDGMTHMRSAATSVCNSRLCGPRLHFHGAETNRSYDIADVVVNMGLQQLVVMDCRR